MVKGKKLTFLDNVHPPPQVTCHMSPVHYHLFILRLEQQQSKGAKADSGTLWLVGILRLARMFWMVRVMGGGLRVMGSGWWVVGL